ncbi:hypothetical protein MO867_04580 [Microbulbifer sp. OS29]|uniref:Uncharacterized protein n=1 Tax=Microbulbifer okhotskensis TaxID=2926617 RepID=A0A9X2J3J5_9GAMM|nr:hypothetical protein [Microbulbifer okhotskensis]MCO1333612.1 hypothetical protein [Microbulbifer okhotskensis]
MRSRAPQQAAQIYQTADQVAEVVLQTIQSEDPPVRIRTSPWANEFGSYKTGLDPNGKKQQQMVIESFLADL